MYRAKKVIQVSSSQTRLRIIPAGDLHYPDQNCDLTAFRKFLKELDKPDTYTILMGDLFDSTLPSNKYYDASQPFTPLDEAYDYLSQLLMPYKDRILACLIGNHEYRLTAAGYGDPIKRLAKDLGVPYLGYSAFFQLIIQWKIKNKYALSNTLSFYLNHGWFAGRKSGSKINNMEDSAATYEADVYIFAHSHNTIATKRVVLHYEGARERVFMNSGTFLKTNEWSTSGYAERRGYPPAKVGTATLVWQPMKHGPENKRRGELSLEL